MKKVNEVYGWADYMADQYDRKMDAEYEIEKASEEAIEDGSAAEKYIDDTAWNIDAPDWVFELWQDMYDSGMIDIDCTYDGEEWLEGPDPDIYICEDEDGVAGPIGKYNKQKFKEKIDSILKNRTDLELTLTEKTFFIGKKEGVTEMKESSERGWRKL